MKRFLFAIMLLITGLGITGHASATNDEKKVYICHAAGQEGTTKYVTLHLSRNAVFKEQGGHFYENGTPRAGHEHDYLGKCDTPTTTTTPDDTVPDDTIPDTIPEDTVPPTDPPVTTQPPVTTAPPVVTTVPPVVTTVPPTVSVVDPPVPTTAAPAVAPATLPRTGAAETIAMVMIGAALLGLGAVAIALARRKVAS